MDDFPLTDMLGHRGQCSQSTKRVGKVKDLLQACSHCGIAPKITHNAHFTGFEKIIFNLHEEKCKSSGFMGLIHTSFMSQVF